LGQPPRGGPGPPARDAARVPAMLGSGSYGVVHKVCRKRDKNICVLKEVDLQKLSKEKDRNQALREAQIMKQLHCPHIIGYLDAFIESGSLFLVLEFCDGGDLKDFLRRTGTRALAQQTIWRMFLRIALGLEYLHSRRILHRDVKSENIFLTGSDGVRLGDLGLAKMLENTRLGTSTLCGTPKYLSPEEAMYLFVGSGSNFDEKCDVWALGVILYELCSYGHLGPFLGESITALLEKIVKEQAPPLPRRTPKVLSDVCGSLLDKNKATRPTIRELLAWPSSIESAEKFGIWELRSPQAEAPAEAESTPGASPSTGPSSTRVSPEVPDGFLSRLGNCFGSGEEEVALGPRFHRLAFCELCCAQGCKNTSFTALTRRHHCRMCGRSVCGAHSTSHRALTQLGYTAPQRICELCSLLPPSGPTQDARPLVIAAERKARAWDSHKPSAPAWSLDQRLQWLALAASRDEGREVLCTLQSGPGAALELRALDAPQEVLHSVPVAAGSSSRAKPSGLLPRRGSQWEVRLAACCGTWFAAMSWVDADAAAVRVLELPSGRCLGHFGCTRDATTALAVQSGDFGFVVTGSENGSVRIWGVPSADSQCTLRSVLPGHSATVTSLAIGGNGHFVCSGSKDSTVRLWRRQRSDASFQANSPAVCEDYRATGSSSICCDGFHLAFLQTPRIGSSEQGVSLWNLALGRWERSFFKRDHNVRCVALRGTVLATSCSSGLSHRGCAVQLWHAPTGTPLSLIESPSPVAHLLLAGLGEDAQASKRRLDA